MVGLVSIGFFATDLFCLKPTCSWWLPRTGNLICGWIAAVFWYLQPQKWPYSFWESARQKFASFLRFVGCLLLVGDWFCCLQWARSEAIALMMLHAEFILWLLQWSFAWDLFYADLWRFWTTSCLLLVGSDLGNCAWEGSHPGSFLVM